MNLNLEVIQSLSTLCLCSSAPLPQPSLRIITYFQIHSILPNKANFRTIAIYVNSFVTSIYDILSHLLGQKTNPIQTQLKPKQTQFNPIQTQFKAKQTQFQKRIPIYSETASSRTPATAVAIINPIWYLSMMNDLAVKRQYSLIIRIPDGGNGEGDRLWSI